MPSPQFQTRLPEEDAEAVREYMEEEDIHSRAEALRRLARAGLDVKGYGDDDGGSIQRAKQTYTILFLVGLVLLGLLLGLFLPF